jgi:hypothetical protein
MIAVLSLLVVVTLSIVITRIAAVALTHTGMARQAARFQARSAFSGGGFTTSESEQVVRHPVRRRIVLILMLLGNAGIVTAVSSLILTFVRQGEAGFGLEIKIPLLVAGLLVLWALASSKLFDRLVSRVAGWLLDRYTELQVRDYDSLLRLGGDYRIAELGIKPESWLDGRTLAEVRPQEEGVLVLGVAPGEGEWFGTSAGDTRPSAGETLVVYGRAEAIQGVEQRRQEADRDHDEAVEKQKNVAMRERSEQRLEKNHGR